MRREMGEHEARPLHARVDGASVVDAVAEDDAQRIAIGGECPYTPPALYEYRLPHDWIQAVDSPPGKCQPLRYICGPVKLKGCQGLHRASYRKVGRKLEYHAIRWVRGGVDFKKSSTRHPMSALRVGDLVRLCCGPSTPGITKNNHTRLMHVVAAPRLVRLRDLTRDEVLGLYPLHHQPAQAKRQLVAHGWTGTTQSGNVHLVRLEPVPVRGDPRLVPEMPSDDDLAFFADYIAKRELGKARLDAQMDAVRKGGVTDLVGPFSDLMCSGDEHSLRVKSAIRRIRRWWCAALNLGYIYMCIYT